MQDIDGFAIVPPAGGEGFVELARSKQGRVFEKHILSYGDLLYPGVKGGKLTIDDEFADTLITNFTNKVCDIVQVPKAGKNNEHTEDPDRNIGEVIGLSKRNGKIYAKIDARIEDDADKLGKTLLGASAMMHLNYKDTKDGVAKGPTLLHVAVTNRPYVTELEDFEELVAASADGKSDAVILTAAPDNKEIEMTKDELIAALSADHGIDVLALQTKAAEADEAIKLSNDLKEKLAETGILKLSNGDEASADDIVGAVAELKQETVTLSGKIETLETSAAKAAAEATVDDKVRGGFILPKNRDSQVKLLLSNADLFEELLPEKPLVKLSQDGDEFGFEPTDEDHEKTVEAEVARLSAIGAD